MPTVKVNMQITVRCDVATANHLLDPRNWEEISQMLVIDEGRRTATFYAWEINPQTQRLDVNAFWGLDDKGQLIKLKAPKEGAGDDALFGMRGRHPNLGLALTKELESSPEKASLPEVPSSILDDRKRSGIKASTKIPGDHSKDPAVGKRTATEDEINARRWIKSLSLLLDMATKKK